jgi:hypothetical protein
MAVLVLALPSSGIVDGLDVLGLGQVDRTCLRLVLPGVFKLVIRSLMGQQRFLGYDLLYA